MLMKWLIGSEEARVEASDVAAGEKMPILPLSRRGVGGTPPLHDHKQVKAKGGSLIEGRFMPEEDMAKPMLQVCMWVYGDVCPCRSILSFQQCGTESRHHGCQRKCSFVKWGGARCDFHR